MCEKKVYLHWENVCLCVDEDGKGEKEKQRKAGERKWKEKHK